MLGRNLKTLRKKNNLTQEDLADSLAVSRQAVCMWERGERTPKISVLTKIAKTFETTIDHIVNRELIFRDDKLKKKDDKHGRV
jgi:transcriptional regulator with XRE-family HTH domain